MGASITLAGESLIAQKHAAQLGLDVTRFIFANVPGLDPSGPVDRAAPRPAAEQIVHVYDIPEENAGYVNPNQVVYSSQIGSDVGDWDFNWIGLETAEGVLFAVAYVPLQIKRRNIPPLQIGNNLTRNFLVAFDGAQALTGITIDARTWQHDFTVRLTGIDERERLSNRDIYGRACFFANALKLEKVGSAYRLNPGTAYVEGIRLVRSVELPVVPPSFPTIAWLDVALQRELNDVVFSWKVVFAADRPDYTDNAGARHYCVAIADLPNSNTVTDRRSVEPINGSLVQHFAIRNVVTRLNVDSTLTGLNRGLVLVDSTAGPRTIRLPVSDNELGVVDLIIRRVDNGSERVVVQASGADKIKFHTHLNAAGYAFLVLMGAGDWWHLRSDGAGSWWPISRYDSTPVGRPVFETTTLFNPGGYGALNGPLFNRAEWPWLWDHAQQSGMLTTEANRTGMEGGWTSGDGATTFRGPEARGGFFRVHDAGKNVDSGRVAGSLQQDALQNITGTLGDFKANSTPSVANTGAFAFMAGATQSNSVGTYIDHQRLSFDASRVVRTAAETRPRNLAYPGRIKLI
ncbi:phage tail protein [Pseudomonas sp. R84]|uniref:phage tail-collar fiber domain-containing protein n=1 Tax=Pseudomonas sp. R84 TaxID=1573712 RepID=UPI0013202986|nr:phage tail protein [Pseudomonas sp. R84]QHC93400.1 phage tail protein [Pseudomonas sp. R84]